MGFWKNTPTPHVATNAIPAFGGGSVNLTKPQGAVSITKGHYVNMEKEGKNGKAPVFTCFAVWGQRDYDLAAHVEYMDGHVEIVSCFGTMDDKNGFSQQTKDGAVRHVSGDKATSNHGGADQPFEVIRIELLPTIRCVMPWVYSAKNSGAGSFNLYGVSTYVLAGDFSQLPSIVSEGQGVSIDAIQASKDNSVYTMVPAVIINDAMGARVVAMELYSRPRSEFRPTVKYGGVTMDTGKENANKPRPK